MSQTLIVEMTVDVTDEDALVDSVRAGTPSDSLQPDDIRPEDRTSSALVAGLSKAVKDLQVAGVDIQDATVLAPR